MEENKKKKIKKGFKIAGITLGSILGVFVLTISTYVIYVFAQYSRIEDNQVLTVNSPVTKEANINEEMKYTSYNIGFGAYSYDYTFFLDRGVDDDGTPQGKEKHGHWSTGRSKEETMRNTQGAINILKELDSDFLAIQEVDTVSNRAHFINQEDEINKGLKDKGYTETWACNFHSAYLAYPFYDPHGASTAGLQTMSKYKISSAVRKSYTLSDSIIDRLFDLDRCFSVNYVELANSDKQLVLINSHMSAYDEGGVVRNEQLKELNGFMKAEYDKGNYVICGGDFNHDLLTNNPLYEQFFENADKSQHNYAFNEQYTQFRPPWVSMMFDSNKECKFDDTFKVVASHNAPTCRGVDEPYTKGQTYVTTVDGFVVSDNVEVNSVLTTQVQHTTEDGTLIENFAYSDHQPTTLTFKLKP